MRQVVLEELSAPGCAICHKFEEFWHSIEKDWPNVTYQNVSVISPEGQELVQKYMIMASPGIILNGALWATGGFDKAKFVEKLKALSEE
jgi:hypothetical protein